MKRLMILGASIGQIPIIKKAKELNYYVCVVDYNPEAVGIKYADEYINASTTDEEAVLKAARLFKPDGITTMQTDMPMRSIARVNEEMNLCGIDYNTSIKTTDKIEMIKCFKNNNIPSPWFVALDDISDSAIKNIKYPCIMKPADSSGSRGVNYLENEKELYDFFQDTKAYSKSGYVLIEEFMTGPEISVEVLIWKSTIYIIAITDKITTGIPHFVELGHKQPSDKGKNIIEKVKKIACEVIRSVGINNGQAHIEMIITEQGPKVVELGARLGGDFITSDLVPLSTGVDMLKATIQIACNEKPDIIFTHTKGSAIRYIESRRGILHSIQNVDEAKKINGVQRIEFLHEIGEVVNNPHSSWDRIGYVISQADSAFGALTICERAVDKIEVEIYDI